MAQYISTALEQVDPEMGRLLVCHREHEERRVPVEVEAAWLHHRFTQIHPYADGNGRVARALTSLVFIKAGWFPLVVTREDRPRYIDALEAADVGGLQSLVSFFIDVQKRALFQAIQAAADTQTVTTVDGAISAARQVLTGPVKGLDPIGWEKAIRMANGLLHTVAERRLEEIAETLTKEIKRDRPEFNFSSGSVQGEFPSLKELE
jgi:hypothetical protein